MGVTGVQFLQWVTGVQFSLQWVTGVQHSLQWVTGVLLTIKWSDTANPREWQEYSIHGQGSHRILFQNPPSFFQSEAKTEKRSQSVTVRGLTIVQRSWWWAMTMSPSCQTRSVATQPAPEAPETSIPAHRPIVNTAFLATSLWFNPFLALITSHFHGEGFLSCYTASHLNSECLCMLWRNQVLETGHPA